MRELRVRGCRSVAGASGRRGQTTSDPWEREGRIQVRNILKLEIPTVTNLKVDNLSAEWWGTEWGERVGKSGYTH
jgi:hypothetical protein